MTPRRCHRQEDPAEGVEGFGAKALGRLHEVLGDFFHHRIQRQDHKGQHDVQGADYRASGVVHQRQGLVDDAKVHQRLIDQSAALQEHQPGIGPHQHAGPERQDHADQNQVGPETLQARSGVGNGEAHDDRQDRHQETDLEGQGEGVPVNAFLENPDVVGQGKPFLGLDRLKGQPAQRHDQQHHDHDQRRGEQQQHGGVLLAFFTGQGVFAGHGRLVLLVAGVGHGFGEIGVGHDDLSSLRSAGGYPALTGSAGGGSRPGGQQGAVLG